jgi:superoxide dismutase, Cu-Zn family
MHQRSAPKTTLIRTTAALLGVGGLLVLGACGNAAPESPASASESPSGSEGGMQSMSPSAATGTGTAEAAPADFTATLKDTTGKELGSAQIRNTDGVMEFQVDTTGMEPGYYGMHVHAVGLCEPDSAAPDNPSKTGAFLSAGGHIGAPDSDHPGHAGDLPTLLVQESGNGHLVFQTDRLMPEDFQDDDGAAVMLHAKQDNYANIPERYASGGPDEDTTKTGDAGDRMACGVIEAGS